MIKYQDELIAALKKNPAEAVAYLDAALEEGDLQLFLFALRNVAEAHGGLGKLAKKCRLNRENLYRMLSKRGNPKFANLAKLLKVLGLELSVKARKV